MTTTEPSLSEGRSEAPEPGRRGTLSIGAWLPTWDLITTKNLEIRKRRGLMITLVVLIVVPTVLFYGLRLLFHAVDPHGHAPAGSPAANGFLPVLPAGPGTAPTPAQVRTAVDKNIASLYGNYVAAEITSSNPADNEMAKIGLWLELDVGIAFLVGLGFGSLTGQRTTTVIVLIALEIIVTPLLARTQLPYFIDGQRLIIGIAMDQLRPAALAAGAAGGGGGGGPGLFGGRGALGIPPMPTWAMISVIVGWIVGWSVIGAWRMMTRDA